jgi:FMN phosphatase YigB (HAD superfamily)
MALLITDLDNTLYDWVTFFAKAFQGMVEELSELLDTDREQLYSEFKALNQSYGTSEQPFTALELPSVRHRFGDLSRRELMRKLDVPLHAFNRLRTQHLRLYPLVAETLRALSDRGVILVGHTESSAENALFRLQKLGIERCFKHLYVLESSYAGHPDPERALALAPPPDFIRAVPPSERKPNPNLLRDICHREGVNPRDACYVGDSLTRDVGMAKAAGVTAVWARYGTCYDKDLWKVLVRVTHWTDEDVRREEELKKEYHGIAPDFTIDSFGEILQLLGAQDDHRLPTFAGSAGASSPVG